MSFLFTKCKYCNYATDVKCNLIRHQNTKHKDEISNNANICPIEENVCTGEQNVCPMCNKFYKTKKHLSNHQSKCKGIDNMTCPKCMTSFTTRSAKHKHVKRGNCKARSIIHARIPNIQNITNNTVNNIQNIHQNIYINNFGSERIDHIDYEYIKQILQCGMNTLPLYIEKKHFDKDFPENNNITFTNENKCKVKENNVWKEKDIGSLSSKLIRDNSEILLLYCDNNELKLSSDICDEFKYKFIVDKLVIIYNKSDNQKYNQVLVKIKDMIKNSKLC